MSNAPTQPPIVSSLPLCDPLRRIGTCLHAAGGRGILVGGAVRDMLAGRDYKDLDIEVFGLPQAKLVAALRTLGPVKQMGRAFSVWQVAGLHADFSLPRAATFDEAVRHRDLRINAIGLDLHDGRIIDPLSGQRDLRAGVLHACDAHTFGEDPLRTLRVAQLMARFEMQPDPSLIALCAAQRLDNVAPERIFIELSKLMLLAVRPSAGLMFLAQTRLLSAFAELDAMRCVPQDPTWHPEGDVWVHTCMVVDCAAALRDAGPDDIILMWAALLHDVGKPRVTTTRDGRIRALNHDVAGQAPAEALLERLRAPNALIKRVSMLVRHHLAPALLHAANASDGAYRRLVRALGRGHVAPNLLARLARADKLGRATPDARAGRDVATDAFEARIARLGLAVPQVPDVVQGRHLIAAGLSPGPKFADVLETCRRVQDESGHTDPAVILAMVLDAPDGAR